MAYPECPVPLYFHFFFHFFILRLGREVARERGGEGVRRRGQGGVRRVSNSRVIASKASNKEPQTT